MSQYIRSDARHILRRDVTAAVEKGVRTSAEREIDGRTRRCSVANKSFKAQVVCGRIARRPDHIDNVIFHAIVDISLVNLVACGDDLFRLDYWIHAQVRRGSSHKIENGALLRL